MLNLTFCSVTTRGKKSFDSQLSKADMENDDQSLNVQDLTDNGEFDDGNVSSCENDDSNELDINELDSNEPNWNEESHPETTISRVKTIHRPTTNCNKRFYCIFVQQDVL